MYLTVPPQQTHAKLEFVHLWHREGTWSSGREGVGGWVGGCVCLWSSSEIEQTGQQKNGKMKKKEDITCISERDNRWLLLPSDRLLLSDLFSRTHKTPNKIVAMVKWVNIPEQIRVCVCDCGGNV